MIGFRFCLFFLFFFKFVLFIIYYFYFHFFFFFFFPSVASRSSPDISVDNHQQFSLENIGVRLKWNRKQLDILIRGVAFPSGLFFCFVFIEQWIASQHGIFTMQMVHAWNFGVNVQETSLRGVTSSSPLVRVAS